MMSRCGPGTHPARNLPEMGTDSPLESSATLPNLVGREAALPVWLRNPSPLLCPSESLPTLQVATLSSRAHPHPCSNVSPGLS